MRQTMSYLGNLGASLPAAIGKHRGNFYWKRASGSEDELYAGVKDSSGVSQLRRILTETYADTLYLTETAADALYEPLGNGGDWQFGSVMRSMAPYLDDAGIAVNVVHSLTHGYQHEGDVADIAFDANAPGCWALYNTEATLGDDAGWDLGLTNPFMLRTNWAPMSIEWRIQTGATLTSVLFWVGCFVSTPMASPDPSLDGFGFRYDTGADLTAFWRCWSNDGPSTGTTTTTTVAITAHTAYTFRVDVVSTTEMRFYIDNVLVATHTTNLPTATTDLIPQCKVRALANAVRSIRWAWFHVRHS